MSVRPTSFRARRAAGRALITALLVAVAPPWLATAMAQPAADAAVLPSPAWKALQDGAVLLLRHASAPGVGDPPGFKLDDCSTQRNLDADGQAQALAIGRAFLQHGVPVGAVWSSAWCRTKETGELAFPGRLRVEPAFSSFFEEAAREPQQTAEARALLLGWRGPGALVVVTHQVNITALTGVFPRSGEGVVLRPQGERLVEVGRIQF